MSILNSTPRIIYGGINDKSRGTPTRNQTTYPQHAPLLRLWCETGPAETTYIGNDDGSFNGLFGQETLKRRGKFFNLQSMLAETLLGAGNGFFVKRLIPADARKARVLVGLEIVRDDVPAVQDRLSGFNLNGQVGGGAPLPPVDGYRARLVTMTATGEVGPAVSIPGLSLIHI